MEAAANKMGIDVGFDIYPPLTSSSIDQNLWIEFLRKVVQQYKSDPVVVKKPDCILFAVGDHPVLYFTGAKTLRFSSKVSGSCGEAEKYINEVRLIAMKYFPDHIHPWEEFIETGTPMYGWSQVKAAACAETPDEDMFLFEHPKPSFVKFSTACRKVLAAFEKIHKGMDGLKFKSASFPRNEGFRIVQKAGSSFIPSRVSSIDGWTSKEKQVSDPIVKKAYWAARCHNNCQTLNRVLFEWLAHCQKQYVILDRSPFASEAIEVSTLSYCQIGLTPRHVGILQEPSCVSKIPPSDDGETYHLFLVGMTSNHTMYAMDCSCAQFGVFGGSMGGAADEEPFIALTLKSYLERIGSSHRMLKNSEQSGLHPLDAPSKVEACLNAMQETK